MLENDVSPILLAMMRAGTGESIPIAIRREQQEPPATWAVKTAYLIDAHSQPSVPRGFMSEFALR
jgi:hypothetical protein